MDARVAPRTTSIVLVAFVDDAEIERWLHERLEAFATKHPARIILLDASWNATADRDEDLWSIRGVRDVDVLDLCALVRELAPYGRHLSLLWAARSISDPRFIELADEADSILLDSSRSVTDISDLSALIAYIRDHDERLVHDLAYLRLHPWQEMIASCFDERVHLDLIDSVTTIEITAGSDAESWYLLAWICDRIGHRIPHRFYREGTARRVRSVALVAPHARFCAELIEGEEVRISITGSQPRAPRTERLNDVDILALLERAILAKESDPLFHPTLRELGSLLAAEHSNPE